jgi:ABC-type phosphate transport system substrate-binding protein
MAEQTPGSLTGATFTQMKMEKRNLRFVAIDGETPSLENYQSGAYPLGKSLYFVLGAKKSSACESFLEFLRSADGVAALHNAGVLARPE